MARQMVDDVSALIDGVPWAHYRRLDRSVRSREMAALAWWPAGWQSVTPRQIAATIARSGGSTLVAGVLSMHRNGWVRAAAVDELGRSNDASALPFLAVRCDDWVEPVRTAAQHLFLAHVNQADPGVLLELLPLMGGLVGPRSRAGDVPEGLRAAVVERITTSDALGAIDHEEPAVRRAAAQLVIDRRAARAALVTALAGGDSVVVGRIARAAVAESDASGVASAELLALLWGGRNGRLRALALHRAVSTEPDSLSTAAWAEDGLLDRAPSVRFVAARHLARQGVDVAARYRTLLDTSVVAIRGLAEVGTEADARAIEPLLADSRAPFRAAAIVAFGRLRGYAGRFELHQALDDPSGVVVAAAGRELARLRLPWAEIEAVRDAVLATEAGDAARRARQRVLNGQERWCRLAALVRLAIDGDDDLRVWATDRLAATVQAWNDAATTPRPEVLRAVQADLPVLADRMPDSIAEQIQWIVNHP